MAGVRGIKLSNDFLKSVFFNTKMYEISRHGLVFDLICLFKVDCLPKGLKPMVRVSSMGSS